LLVDNVPRTVPAETMVREKAGGEPAKELREERRVELLDAAYALVGEKGLEGLRTRDIAARAGVNISTLHYYFGTKEALLAALTDHVGFKFAEANAKQAQASARTRGKNSVLVHLETAWRSFQTTPHLSTVLQELVLRAERDAEARAAFKRLHLAWNGIVEEIMRDGIARGELRADLDAHAAARIVTSFIIGAMTQLRVNKKAFDFDAVARELTRWMGA
jgi:AcrR family transcriptional regulator